MRSGAFAAAFLGPAGLAWLVAALALRAGARRAALGWALVALGDGRGVAARTAHCHLPIDEALAGWHPARPPADWLVVRERWSAADHWRSWAASRCFWCHGMAVGSAAAARFAAESAFNAFAASAGSDLD